MKSPEIRNLVPRAPRYAASPGSGEPVRLQHEANGTADERTRHFGVARLTRAEAKRECGRSPSRCGDRSRSSNRPEHVQLCHRDDRGTFLLRALRQTVSTWPAALLFGLSLTLTVSGCRESSGAGHQLPSSKPSGGTPATSAAVPSAQGDAPAGSSSEQASNAASLVTSSQQPGSVNPEPAWKRTPIYAFLHQPFEEAIQSAPPPGARRPPDVTVTGKSVGKLFEAVRQRWPEIVFVSPRGTLRRPLAELVTELGTMEIELWPEVAPNHVRAFVALAECGYYDGLFFELRLGNRESSGLPRAIGGGSPEANAQETASIGFWLKPEILLPEKARARGIRHQPGSLFCHWLGCFFYIGLTEAPMWDGEYVLFGRVARSLEVGERIFDALGTDANPPQIHRVSIRWQDTGKTLDRLP